MFNIRLVSLTLLRSWAVKMQHTSCTEDRIQHALDRCLDGLRQSPTAAQHWNGKNWRAVSVTLARGWNYSHWVLLLFIHEAEKFKVCCWILSLKIEISNRLVLRIEKPHELIFLKVSGEVFHWLWWNADIERDALFYDLQNQTRPSKTRLTPLVGGRWVRAAFYTFSTEIKSEWHIHFSKKSQTDICQKTWLKLAQNKPVKMWEEQLFHRGRQNQQVFI